MFKIDLMKIGDTIKLLAGVRVNSTEKAYLFPS